MNRETKYQKLVKFFITKVDENEKLPMKLNSETVYATSKIFGHHMKYSVNGLAVKQTVDGKNGLALRFKIIVNNSTTIECHGNMFMMDKKTQKSPDMSGSISMLVENDASFFKISSFADVFAWINWSSDKPIANCIISVKGDIDPLISDAIEYIWHSPKNEEIKKQTFEVAFDNVVLTQEGMEQKAYAW